MSKRQSKGVRFFCSPKELQGLLHPVLAESQMRLCSAKKTREGSDERYFLRETTSSEMADATVPQVYACNPAMTGVASLDSLANIIQIWLPVMKDQRLSMGEVGMLVTESELPLPVRKLEMDVYEKIRKVLANNFRSGVWARNSNTGGEHFYGDILISEAATLAYADGTVLAPQLGDGFVTYHLHRFAS